MFVPIDVTQISIETARLRLRPWRESDLNAFYTYASEPGVGEMAGWPHHENIETTREVLNSFIAHKNVFAIADRETDEVIGSLGLHDSWASEDARFSSLRLAEIGYVLKKEKWGQGLMPEAVKAVIETIFARDLLDAFAICHFITNPQSGRVVEKIGFAYMQNSIYHSRLMNVDFEERQYLLTREMFESRNTTVVKESL